MVQVARSRIENLIASSSQKAGLQQQQLIDDSITKMDQLMSNELQRLQQLAEKNSHIKPSEIASLHAQQQQLQQYLQHAELKLDALRLIIVTEAG